MKRSLELIPHLQLPEALWCAGDHCWAVIQKELIDRLSRGHTKLYYVNIPAAYVHYTSLGLGNCPAGGLASWACVTWLSPSFQGSCISPQSPLLHLLPPSSVSLSSPTISAVSGLTFCLLGLCRASFHWPLHLKGCLVRALTTSTPHGGLFSKCTTLCKVALKRS